MDTTPDIEERLWNYIDGLSSPEEKTRIEKLLQSQQEWKDKYNELLEVNQLLASTELDEPSMRFTKNVMEEIAKQKIAPATRTYLNKRIIWGIGIFFIFLLLSVLIYGFSQVEWTNGTPDTIITDTISKVDFSKFFNNSWVNAFVIVNVILGLFLLDAYLSNKRKKFRKEA